MREIIMRQTSKTIEFDFSFTYSKGGQYEEAKSVTVCEPNFDNRAVFRKMSGYIALAQKGLVKTFSGLSRSQIEEQVEEKAPVEAPAEAEALATLSMGLEIDAYEEMLRFVEKALTSNKHLAYVGNDPQSRVPVTEEVWRNIAEAGGLEQMERVIGAFASFFMGTPSAKTSPKTSGTDRSSTSVAAPAASSRTTKH
jgi:hypothetical protein